jgi:L-amino acid N-acyltransferase YncA
MEDAGAIAAIYRSIVECTVISFETVPPDQEEIAFRLAQTMASYPWLVCEIDGHVAGYAYASQHQTRAAYRWSVNTSVYIDSDHRRRGVGRALYASLFGILRRQGFFNAYAGVTLPNAASIALHESVGFAPIGVYASAGYKMGGWHDVGWWQLRLQPLVEEPTEPIPLPALLERVDWQDLVRAGEALIVG